MAAGARLEAEPGFYVPMLRVASWFRSNWSVNPSTGEYTASLGSPTGIPADPALTAHGVDQAKDLAAHLATVNPPIEQVYSSPYYRCLQTVEPFVNPEQGSSGDPRQGQQQQEAADGKTKFRIRAETGLGEWYGSAPFEHPRPAGLPVLRRLFPRSLDVDYRPIARPTGMGESIAELHDRVAATMEGIVARCDRDGTRAILICSHAATVIALGRVLTGNMPDDVEVEDFRAFTCGLSVYRRREAATVAPSPMLHKDDGADSSGGLVAQDGLLVQQQQQQQQQEQQEEQYSLDPDGGSVGGSSGNNKNSMAAAARTLVNDDGRYPSDERKSHADPIRAGGDPPHGQAKDWRGGVGVAGGWLCLVNSECSFLKGGEERGWRFSGDEAFTPVDQRGIDAGLELGVVVEGKAVRRSEPGDTNKSRL